VGRGYVLRRILRRALRFGREILKAPDGFFHKLVPVVVQTLGKAFPELTVAPEKVMHLIELEERLFLKSLDMGLRQFSSIVKNLREGDTIPAKDSVLLATTFGFDIELQKLMAEEKGLRVDMNEFHKLMNELKEQSRESALAKEGVIKLELTANALARLERELRIAPTNDLPKYELEDIEARVLAIWAGPDKEFQSSWSKRDTIIGLILDRTNFYAEAGGQIYDTGLIVSTSNNSNNAPMKFAVENVQLFGGYVLHIGHLEEGELTIHQSVNLTIDIDRRRAVTSNHTATHLINFALRKVLGDSTDQKGLRAFSLHTLNTLYPHTFSMIKQHVYNTPLVLLRFASLQFCLHSPLSIFVYLHVCVYVYARQRE
jgi:alanyl-tRNA synthetase